MKYQAFPLVQPSNRMYFPLFFPLRAETRESFLLPVDYPIQQSGGVAFRFPRRVGVDVHRSTDVRVPQQFLHVLRSGPIGQEIACEGVPLWHNKDKSENPCGATGWLVCPYSFSTKNDPKMGPAGGGEKPRLHLKDKFFGTDEEVEHGSLGHHCKAK